METKFEPIVFIDGLSYKHMLVAQLTLFFLFTTYFFLFGVIPIG